MSLARRLLDGQIARVLSAISRPACGRKRDGGIADSAHVRLGEVQVAGREVEG